MLCSAGCGKDDGKDEGKGGGGDVPAAGMGGAAAGAGAGGASAAGSGGAGGAPSMPAGGSVAMMPQIMDAGVMGDAGEPPVVLPMDGNALSVCASSDDCNGDDLRCALFGSYQGYCAEDCAADDDCEAIGGLAPTCDDDGVCVIDCAGGADAGVDAGTGECPADMVCAEIMESALDQPIYRCQYPEPKNLGIYEVCEDDAECAGELTCEVPGLLDLRDTICSAACEEATECDDLGSGATPVCDLAPLSLDGMCALDCQQDDECPSGMTCIEVDLLTSRCGHEL